MLRILGLPGWPWPSLAGSVLAVSAFSLVALHPGWREQSSQCRLYFKSSKILDRRIDQIWGIPPPVGQMFHISEMQISMIPSFKVGFGFLGWLPKNLHFRSNFYHFFCEDFRSKSSFLKFSREFGHARSPAIWCFKWTLYNFEKPFPTISKFWGIQGELHGFAWGALLGISSALATVSRLDPIVIASYRGSKPGPSDRWCLQRAAGSEWQGCRMPVVRVKEKSRLDQINDDQSEI